MRVTSPLPSPGPRVLLDLSDILDYNIQMFCGVYGGNNQIVCLVIFSQETLSPGMLPSPFEKLNFHAMRNQPQALTETMCQYLDQEPRKAHGQELALTIYCSRHQAGSHLRVHISGPAASADTKRRFMLNPSECHTHEIMSNT